MRVQEHVYMHPRSFDSCGIFDVILEKAALTQLHVIIDLLRNERVN